MKAIILGHTSMLGGALKRALSEGGHAYLTAGRSSDCSIRVDLGAQPSSQWYQDSYDEADCIFVLASSFEGDSLRGLTQNILTNTAGCANVFSLAEATSAKIIVYAGSISSYKEFDIERGLSSYGLSKALAEELSAWWSERNGIRFVSVRLSQLYDDHGLCVGHQPWIGRIIRYGFERKDLCMPVSRGKRNFLHVDDAAGLMLEAALDSSRRGVLNGCSPSNYSYRDLAELVFRHNRCLEKLHTADTKVPFRAVSLPSDPLFFRSISWGPRVSLATWVKRISYLKSWNRFGPMDVGAG